MRRLPAGPGPIGARIHEIRREAHDALIDKDDPEGGEGIVQADLETRVRDAQAAQYVDGLDAARAPTQLTELPVAF